MVPKLDNLEYQFRYTVHQTHKLFYLLGRKKGKKKQYYNTRKALGRPRRGPKVGLESKLDALVLAGLRAFKRHTEPHPKRDTNGSESSNRHATATTAVRGGIVVANAHCRDVRNSFRSN